MKREYRANGAAILPLPGVRTEGETVVIEGYDEKAVDEIREWVAAGGRRELTSEAKAYKPTPAELEALKAQIDADRLDKFLFIETIAAETLIDRHRDKFTVGFLKRMAERYGEGRAVVDSHDTSTRIGRTYSAKVERHPEKEGEHRLIVKFYISPNTPDGAKAIEQVKDGIVNRVSVSFRPDYRKVSYVAPAEGDKDGRGYWTIDAGDKNEEEVIELSLVAMGAQPGAKFKGENGGKAPLPTFGEIIEEKEMELTQLKLKAGQEFTLNVKPEDAEAVKAVSAHIEKLEGDLKAASDKLKKYADKEAEEKTALVNEYVNLKTALYGDLIKAEDETETAKGFAFEFLSKEIGVMKQMVAKKGKGLDVQPPKTTEKAKGTLARLAALETQQ